MEQRIRHDDLIQGSDEWLAFRLEHDGASEAAAMLGLSKKATRSELMRLKNTGIPKEFSDWVQEKILDYGHEVEAKARPIIAEMIGEELKPYTFSLGRPSASCDGITESSEIAFEHKQWNEALAASVLAGILPEEHKPQCQQNLMVTGAERLLFVVSDGTEEKMVWMWVEPDHEWFARIRAGWDLFHSDRVKNGPIEVIPAAVPEVTIALPVPVIEVGGAISITSNLTAFGVELQRFIANVPKEPNNDQEFANCKDAIKKLKEAEESLDYGESAALQKIQPIAEMRDEKDRYFKISRNFRLSLEKLVTRRETEIKEEEVTKGRTALDEHIAGLNKRIGKALMPTVPADFATAIKNKRLISSLRESVSNELTRAILAANAIADKIEINLRTIQAVGEQYIHLFNDENTLVLKSEEDLANVIQVRKSAEDARTAKIKADAEEAERGRIADEAEKQRLAALEQEEREKKEREEKRKRDEENIQPATLPEVVETAAAESPAANTLPEITVTPSAPISSIRRGPALVSARTNPSRPTDDQIIGVLASNYRVHESKVIEWLLAMDLPAASERMVAAI